MGAGDATYRSIRSADFQRSCNIHMYRDIRVKTLFRTLTSDNSPSSQTALQAGELRNVSRATLTQTGEMQSAGVPYDSRTSYSFARHNSRSSRRPLLSSLNPSSKASSWLDLAWLVAYEWEISVSFIGIDTGNR